MSSNLHVSSIISRSFVYLSIYGIYIAPLQGNYSEALLAQTLAKRKVFVSQYLLYLVTDFSTLPRKIIWLCNQHELPCTSKRSLAIGEDLVLGLGETRDPQF